MLNTLKGLLNVVGKQILTVEGGAGPKSEPSEIDPNVGAEILSHYQEEWSEIHRTTEENATAANQVADEIERVYSKVTKDHESLQQIGNFLSGGALNTQIDGCLRLVEGLHVDFDRVEKSLMALEDLIEKIELEQRKIDHRHQLSLYKEKKLASLENARKSLETKHAQNVIDHELKQRQILRERQQVFQEAFEKDLQSYKSGTLKPIDIPKNKPSALEDIQLEIDKEALDQFLEEN